MKWNVKNPKTNGWDQSQWSMIEIVASVKKTLAGGKIYNVYQVVQVYEEQK